MGLAGVSLAAAVPGGILFAVLLLAAVNHLGTMPTALKAVAILVMLLGLAMTLFPLYILIWYRGQKVVLAKDNPSLAFAGATAAGTGSAAGSGALADSFLEDFNPSTEEIMEDMREAEVFAETGEFSPSDEFSAAEEFEADDALELTGDSQILSSGDQLGIDEDNSSMDIDTLNFESDDHQETTEFASDDFLSSMESAEEEEAGSETELLAGGGLDDDFNFELFDDEDDKKS